MSKKECDYNLLAVMLFSLIFFIIGIIVCYQFWYLPLRNEYYNYRAGKECPMMQYESGELKTETKIFEEIPKEKIDDYTCLTAYSGECINCSFTVCSKTWFENKNFTTGRYLLEENRIECGGYRKPEGCYYRNEDEYWEFCFDKTQKFTPEEFRLR